MVLSAAEIKAIASGNPQIVRKVQLEAEVARLDRVRSVWLDTRRNLQLECHVTEEEIRRLEGRCVVWEQAAAIVGNHPHEPFRAEVERGIGAAVFEPITARADAGAAVRRLIHAYQSAAAFQRTRLREVVARYRGLELVVQAHAVFAADLSLALPDGTTLDTVTAATDTGVWQSVGRTVSEIPSIRARLQGRIAAAQERIVTIDRELVRLEQWDGQATYDAAASELRAINAAFAAAEEQASAERAQGMASAGASAAPAAEASPEAASLADVLLTLAHEERAREGWAAWVTLIPPASASLAWMAAEAERLAISCPPRIAVPDVDGPDAEVALLLAREVALFHSSRKAHVQFGDARTQRRSTQPEPTLHIHSEAEVRQLPLF